MSNDTRSANSPATYAVRYGVSGGVLLVIALVVYGLVKYPSAFALAPVESIVYLGLSAVLLGSYGWLALRQSRTATPARDITLRWGGWLGLALGACWLTELWAGNLADPSANPLAWLVYRGSTLAVPALIFVTAFYASRQVGEGQIGVRVGLWSGIISALITFTGLAIIAYSGTLLHDPQTIQQAARSGVSDIMAYGVADSLAGAINHLWIGPLLGIVFGAAGGLLGAAGRLKNHSAV